MGVAYFDGAHIHKGGCQAPLWAHFSLRGMDLPVQMSEPIVHRPAHSLCDALKTTTGDDDSALSV